MQKNVTRLIGILALMLGACGGSYSPVTENHSGDIADGDSTHGERKCDAYEISVGEGWRVTATMTSEWDNYLYLVRGETEVATNDDSDGTNARIETNVTEAGTHTVYACAYSDGRGAYTLNIVTAAGN